MSGKRKQYFRFYLFALIAWVIVIIFSWALTNYVGSEISSSIAGILFVYGACGIPIIVFFSIIVQLAEYIIDRIPHKFSQKANNKSDNV